jgi:ATP-dependent DNA helicase RecG
MSRLIDTRLDFLSPVATVPGLGTKRVAALAEAGITTLGGLLYHFPRRYVDRSKITPIAQCPGLVGSSVNVIGEVTRTRVERGRGARQRLRIQLTDDSGSMEVLWFAGIPYFRAILHTGLRVLCTGVVSAGTVSVGTGPQLIHPLLERIGEGKEGPDIIFLPVYPLTNAMKEAGIAQKLFCKTILWALDNIKHYPQILPSAIEKKRGFPPLDKCIREMHVPKDPLGLGPFRDRIVYEELYGLALTIRFSKRNFRLPGRSMKPGGDLRQRLESILPFQLTADQKQAIAVLLRDAESPTRMHRLLQGDVGCGKTIVALFACLPALGEGRQVAWLAPTEVLANQTHSTLSALLDPLGISHALLTGSTPADHRRRIATGLSDKNLRFLVGTHALLEPNVTFGSLGMVVIDEQHRFGARQRLTLSQKDPAADVLVMSATPIPQTLAKTLYGDLDIISIKSLPTGRLPVNTHLVPLHKRADLEKFVCEQVMQHDGQAFYVAPRIEPGDDDDDDPAGDGRSRRNGLHDVNALYESLRNGPFSSVSVGLIHGRMDPAERDGTMADFRANRIKVLVATTVIEVGIDVPAATVLIIENAERFGLSQLHQLRGRVGRSNRQSYCFLFADAPEGSMAQKRLAYFCGHQDGFDIAEMDLALRGPGEVAGMRQSGWEDLVMADILRDARLFCEIQNDLDGVILKTTATA